MTFSTSEPTPAGYRVMLAGMVFGMLVLFSSCQDATNGLQEDRRPETVPAKGTIPSFDEIFDPQNVIKDYHELDKQSLIVDRTSQDLRVPGSTQGGEPDAYVMTDLGTLGGPGAFGTDINNRGEATGASAVTGDSGTLHAFLYDGTSLSDLGTILSLANSAPRAMNNNSQIVGEVYDSRVRYQTPFIWSPDNGMRTLLDGAPNGFAKDINDHGQVIGFARGVNIYLWNDEDGAQSLQPMIGHPVTPQAINNRGQITGYFNNNGFYWDHDNGFTDLDKAGISGAVGVFPQDINDRGQITGHVDMGGRFLGFIWDPDEGAQLIDTDDGSKPSFILPRGLNNRGEVVGYKQDNTGGTSGFRAFVWNREDGITDLGVLDEDQPQFFNFSQARDINDEGEIIGYSANADGFLRAILWSSDSTPPEIFYTLEAKNLWPANHKMVLSVTDIFATDNKDPAPELDISISSNEPANGKGDGDTGSDWKIVTRADGRIDVYLRAERSGKGSGRTYTVTMTATDNAGNEQVETVEVTVQHDKRRRN